MLDDEGEPDDEALFEGGRRLIAAIVGLARVCSGEGDTRWDAMLDKLGLEPLPEHRDRAGVPATELHRALEAGIAPLLPFMSDGSRLRELVLATVREYEAALPEAARD